MLMSPLKQIIFWALLAAPISASFAAADADDPYRRERTEFIRIYQQIENGSDIGAAASEALRAYPLFPYLQAARLRRRRMSFARESSPKQR